MGVEGFGELSGQQVEMRGLVWRRHERNRQLDERREPLLGGVVPSGRARNG